MIDFIELIKHLTDKDKLNLGHLQLVGKYASGIEIYWIEGCRKMELHYNRNHNYIKIKGSPLYLIQGHNFSWEKRNFLQAIRYIESLIQVNLLDSYVDMLEYGKIIQTEMKPQRIIGGHLAGEKLTMNEALKDKGNIRYYNDKHLYLKLYNAGSNIQHKQGLKMQEVLQELGWNPKGNFVKFEAHYKKPHKYFNKGKGLLLSDILIPSFEATLKEDLMYQYKRLEKMKSIEIPSDKKDLSTASIILLAMAEKTLNQGEDLTKILISFVNSIPKEILTKDDKKARRGQLIKLVEKIRSSGDSQFDVSELLEAALKK